MTNIRLKLLEALTKQAQEAIPTEDPTATTSIQPEGISQEGEQVANTIFEKLLADIIESI
jgi:hypothetical protein